MQKLSCFSTMKCTQFQLQNLCNGTTAITLQDLTQGTCLQGTAGCYDISLSRKFTSQKSNQHFSADKLSQLTEFISQWTRVSTCQY
jgi:hypothetical protein